jgi:two-component system phosphate regulon response regulator PhoB
MSTKTILVIDDEPDIREIIRFALENANYAVLEAEYVEVARNIMKNTLPDLILLDWMLPGRSGLEFAQELKQNLKLKNIPIIMISAKSEELDRIRGLDKGQVDDYVTKPFSPSELVSRIKAVMRRTFQNEMDTVVEINGLKMDHSSHRVTVDGKQLDMAPVEYRLLHFFMTHQNRVFTRSQLLDHVWGEQIYLNDRTVDVHIRRLRKTLEVTNHDKLLQTVRNVGYRFSEQE